MSDVNYISYKDLIKLLTEGPNGLKHRFYLPLVFFMYRNLDPKITFQSMFDQLIRICRDFQTFDGSFVAIFFLEMLTGYFSVVDVLGLGLPKTFSELKKTFQGSKMLLRDGSVWAIQRSQTRGSRMSTYTLTCKCSSFQI